MADGRMQVGMILNSTTAEPAVPSELRRKRPEDMSKEDLPKTPPKKRLAHLPILFETFAHTYAQGQQHHTVEDAHSSPHHHGHASLPPNAWPAFSFCADNAPPRDVISRCIASFSRGYGDMYWLLPEDCIMDLFRGAYSPAVNRNNGDNANGGSLNHLESSLLLLCAAVGAVYLEDCDPTAAAHKEDFFLSGKAGLDAVVLEGRKVPDAVARLQISACALVALYDMFEKRISARGYIGQAIHLALSTGLDQTSPASTRPAMNQGAHGHAEMSAADVDSWSRVWRSLVFLDGWMSNSVGLAPVIDSNVLANVGNPFPLPPSLITALRVIGRMLIWSPRA
ncbi:hypothetical protein DFH27DRAFT_312818 [Peziza echinospora]|nr:hypothetical protein DFH27DRAFT_312818 [Peziza echinospora]